MKLVIVSGLSGSGKTIALHTLEDAGYFCVDNLPVGLLPDFIDNMQHSTPSFYDLIAVSVDARSGAQDMARFKEIVHQVADMGVEVVVLYLTTEIRKLLTRFSETRRKHPLTRKNLPLIEAIELERSLLKSVYSKATLRIDTSNLNVHQLREMILSQLVHESREKLVIVVQSFGFKHGLPSDTDFIFDVRCLPNPHWDNKLRAQTGKDEAVIEYLSSFESVRQMLQSIYSFMNRWVPSFEQENRSYMTISVGCTGGQHRSVYIADKLAETLGSTYPNVSARHRDLS